MSVKLKCPKCGRILGDTNKSTDARVNCHNCKEAVRVNVKIIKWADYLPERRQND